MEELLKEIIKGNPKMKNNFQVRRVPRNGLLQFLFFPQKLPEKKKCKCSPYRFSPAKHSLATEVGEAPSNQSPSRGFKVHISHMLGTPIYPAGKIPA